jgi:exopolyphosphatase / guanosine-5'-triphosphate,3'-diphosphate pyrophosphatase
MYGIIDIGSNTIRLNIYRIVENKPILLLSKKNSTGLASYINQGHMSTEGLEHACTVLTDFKVLLDYFKVESFAFATAALRNIDNSEEAVTELSQRTGMAIVVLPGEKEAELDFIGVTSSMPVSGGILIDIGGASTELVIYQGKKILKAFSMPLGSLNMYNQYVQHLIPNRSERKLIKQAVLTALSQDDDFFHAKYQNITEICGVGGTIRAAGKLNNELFDLPSTNMEINTPNIKKLIRLLENDEDDELISIDTLDILLKTVPDRVRTVLPGMIVLHTLIKYFNSKIIHISTTGVREGYLYSQVLGNKDVNTHGQDA